jgi:hypothetical protein
VPDIDSKRLAQLNPRTKLGFMRALAVTFLFPALLLAGRGEDLLRSIHESGLDPGECYRIREISLVRDEAQFYFTDGYLIFGKPVGGTRVTAVFSADVEGGEAELLLLPPNRSERRALAAHAGAPNLEEHFHASLMVFADDTYREILEQIRANPYNKKSGEMGALMADKWSPMARDLSSSFGPRLAADLLSPGRRKGFFAAAIAGRKLGSFDLVFDARVPEQLLIGAMAKDNFELWSSFISRSFRSKAYTPEFALNDYRIQSTLDADLTLHCTTRVKAELKDIPEGALPFEISQAMNVTSATIDGAAAEVLLNSDAVRDMGGNHVFLLVPAQPLALGVHEIEIHHEGKVISDAGNHVYFVGSRGSWYPGRGMQFSTYDLTFRSPADLDLVATGDPVEDRVVEGQRITRRRTTVPIRLAGFNLGVYDRARIAKGLFTIEVCANRAVEDALQPRVPDISWSLPTVQSRPNRRPTVEMTSSAPPRIHASKARLEALASDLGEVMDFYAERFGPPPLHHLEVSPVPGRFGQGFPGMIYLSTTCYLPVLSSLNERQQIFFSDLLHAHEAAHQWWGSIVTSAGYHDDWILESLANYSALLFMEKHKGSKAVDLVLDDYRAKLLMKGGNDETVESAGPIVQGLRLGAAWQTIVYGKGTWIVHMLRRRLGDEAFAKMLASLRREFEYKTLTTEQFRLFCAGFLPPKSADPKLEAFFDQWVYGTGIPALKLTYKVRGLQVSGTVTESGVPDDFAATVPIEIQAGQGKPVARTVRAALEPEPFEFKMAAPPTKVAIDLRSILHR